MVCILGKVESDGFFERVSIMFEGIIESEMLYAVIGKAAYHIRNLLM